MSKAQSLGRMAVSQMEKAYPLKKLDLGRDARLSKNGMVFETEAYEIPETGHLCVLRMKAMLGLMRMETVVLAMEEKDVPLLNLDWVRAFGRETQIAEFYDTLLSPCPPEALAGFQAVCDRDADLPDMEAKPHWYDALLLPCSYHKAGRVMTERLAAAAHDDLACFLRLVEEAPACDPAAKKAKTRAFAERLCADGGPAVSQMEKLFGRETARRLILQHMYHVK